MSEEEYVPGEEVTAQARSKKTSKDVVLSVRMPIELLAELEAVANREDKPLSRVVRAALRRGLHPIPQPQITTTGAPVTVVWGSVQ